MHTKAMERWEGMSRLYDNRRSDRSQTGLVTRNFSCRLCGAKWSEIMARQDAPSERERRNMICSSCAHRSAVEL